MSSRRYLPWLPVLFSILFLAAGCQPEILTVIAATTPTREIAEQKVAQATTADTGSRGAIKVNIYFSNQQLDSNEAECGKVFPVSREISADENTAAGALRQLFSGATTPESSLGYSSLFSADTRGILKDLTIEDGTAYVNLSDIRSLLPETITPCMAKELLAEIEATLKDAAGVGKVIMAIDGKPKVFYDWLELRCDESNDHCDPAPFAGGTPAVITPGAPTRIPGSPEGVLQQFYGWYLSALQSGNSPLASKTYRQSEYLTEAFKTEIDRQLVAFEEGGIDPLLCSREIPQRAVVQSSQITGEGAEALVSINDGADSFLVRLQQDNNTWKINAVACQGENSSPAQGVTPVPSAGMMNTFIDKTYGYSIAYPKGWLVGDAIKIDVPTSSVMKRILLFSPDGWKGPVVPVSIEVSQGKLQDYPGYLEPVEISAINGQNMLISRSSNGEIYYIFTHPGKPELHVALRDNVGALADLTTSQKEELESSVQQMLAGFVFSGS